jgi:hypothetical protein
MWDVFASQHDRGYWRLPAMGHTVAISAIFVLGVGLMGYQGSEVTFDIHRSSLYTQVIGDAGGAGICRRDGREAVGLPRRNSGWVDE